MKQKYLLRNKNRLPELISRSLTKNDQFLFLAYTERFKQPWRPHFNTKIISDLFCLIIKGAANTAKAKESGLAQRYKSSVFFGQPPRQAPMVMLPGLSVYFGACRGAGLSGRRSSLLSLLRAGGSAQIPCSSATRLLFTLHPSLAHGPFPWTRGCSFYPAEARRRGTRKSEAKI